MPRPRFNKLDPEKKKAILDAAAEEFAEHGFEGASYNKIIEKAGVSKGAMYYYFDDKDDLYGTVMKDRLGKMVELLVANMPRIETADQFWRVTQEMIHRTKEFTTQDPVNLGLMRTLMKLRFSNVQNAAVQEMIEMSREWSRKFLRIGQKVGAVRDDLPVDLLVAVTRGLDDAADRWFASQHPDFTPEDIDRWSPIAMDLFRRIVAPPSPKS